MVINKCYKKVDGNFSSLDIDSQDACTVHLHHLVVCLDSLQGGENPV